MVGAGADFLVADDVSIGVALAGLAAIQMWDSCSADWVFLSIVITFALLGVTSNHAGLGASTCVASISVDPGLSDRVFLTGISEAKADSISARNLTVLLTGALVAVFVVGLAHSHWLVGHRVSAAGVGGARHLERLSIAGASVSTVISGFREGLSSGILNSVVIALAIDSVVRNKIASVLLAGESSASIAGC